MNDAVAFVPFHPAHLARLSLQPMQAELQGFLASVNADNLVGAFAWSALVVDQVVGCGGLMPFWSGVGQAWAVVGAVPRRSWPTVTRFVRSTLHTALDGGGFHRIQTSVKADWPAGQLWADRLGFDFEGRCRAYDPWQVDHDLYAMVRV